ncbi:MAG: phytanoyl-CoA dioxygenase family protein, partial [Chloroflexi bacterium]|nr:phytanoyl-CoA dioxygenase family protein [Chloroflexota bacterium]
DGFVVLRGLLSEEQRTRLVQRVEMLWSEEGEQAGGENYIENGARRLANLVNKGGEFRLIIAHPEVLEVVRAVIGPFVRLSMLNARDVPPHTDPRMPFHSDSDHGGKVDETGYYVCTAIWMLDDYTRLNGSTRIIPGTHRSDKLPKEALADVTATQPNEVVVEGKAGDVLVFNGHCWHTGGANATDVPRRAILAHYIRADHPQRLNQKEALSPEIQAKMNPLERQVLGLDD